MRHAIPSILLAPWFYAVCAFAEVPPSPILFGETLSGSIAVFGEVDTYSFTGATNDRVLISMVVTSGDLDPAIELEDPQGKQICA
ncbi:MAG TPA: hypothetical protein VFR03_01900, partial [Thermoanaerobaculia bacterium]|nr:hypothetical protein [Thermoanaerobaculia bacterium]